MQSDKVTNEKPMTLTLSPKKSCLLLYISLCEKCTLNIPEVESYHYVSTSSQASDIHFWQVYKLELKSDHENTLTFYKERVDNATMGFWGIDIQDCPNIKDNMVAYEINIPENETNNYEYKCGILNGKYEKNGATRRNRYSEKLMTLGCNRGKFGNNCEINCGNILGDEYEYCQEHRLCQNENCTCAWCYTGSSCNICQSEQFLFCKNHTILTRGSYFNIAELVFALIVTGIILSILYIYYRKKRKCEPLDQLHHLSNFDT
jgi:hypothetical protein